MSRFVGTIVDIHMTDDTTTQHVDIAIVGGGPAGLTAALYVGRNQVKSALFEPKEPGGQLLNTELIEDYPGFASILGRDLAGVMLEQARSFGTQFVDAGVQKVERGKDGLFTLTTDRGTWTANAVIMTAGGNPRHLDVPGEKELAGRGVSYCAVCDGAFFRGRDLVVVGGGDAALEEGAYLTRYANKVTIVHRRDRFRAQEVVVAATSRNEKVEYEMDHVVISIDGDAGVTKVQLAHATTGEPKTLDAGGVFIFVGFIPNTTLVAEHVDHDAGGYYMTDPLTMMTSVPGLFAAGDVRAQLTRQITTAVGDATTAALAATKWIEERAQGNDDPFAHLRAASAGAVARS